MKFSVTIPAYKSKYLAQAITSVLNQEFDDFELIIVDDCSPEDIKSIVDNYSDSHIRFYRNERNCGAIDVVDNWNICLKYCTGEYVICMGDDDRMLPNCLLEYSSIIDKFPGLNVYHGWTEIIDEDGNVYETLEPRVEKESVFELIYYRWRGRRQYIGDFCYRTEHLLANNGYYKIPLAWGSDDITAIRAAVGLGIANTQIPVFQYRVSRYTISQSSQNTKIKLSGLVLERQYIENYLDSLEYETLSIYDKWYFDALLLIKDESYINRMVGEIELDLKQNFFKCFSWLRICGFYGVPKKKIIKIVLKSLHLIY